MTNSNRLFLNDTSVGRNVERTDKPRRMRSDATSDSETKRAVNEGLWLFWWLSNLQFPIKLLKYEEGFFLLTVIGDKSFAIEIILNTRERSPRATKVFEYPRCHSAKEGNAFQHDDLVLVKIFLILLGPPGEGVAMVAKERVATEFTHDQRLVVLGDPIN